MGKMDLIKSNWTGKVGKTVGAKWKNQSTIRSYTPPTYTDTPAQQTIRTGFGDLTKYLSLLAPQLKPYSALDTRGMSIRNALIKLNKAEVIGGTLDPTQLLMSKGGLPQLAGATAAVSGTTVTVTFTPATSPIISAKAQAIAIWYNAAHNNCLVAAALNTAGSVVIQNATGAATADDIWVYLLDKRGSSKVASPSVHLAIA